MRYKEWWIKDQKKVIWSDEAKINRITSDGIQFTWHKDNEDGTKSPIVNLAGGNFMLCESMAWSGPGAIVQVIGGMIAKQYLGILYENLMRCMEITSFLGDMPMVDQLIFQQDNDPKHTALAKIAHLESKGIKGLN